MPSATAILTLIISLLFLGIMSVIVLPAIGTAFVDSMPVLDSSSPFAKTQTERAGLVKTAFSALPILMILIAIPMVFTMFMPRDTDTYETNYPVETGSRSRRDTGEELAAIARRTEEENRQRRQRETEQTRQEQVQELSNLGINDITPEPQPPAATLPSVQQDPTNNETNRWKSIED